MFQQDIIGLDVAVNHAAAMCVAERPRYLLHHARRVTAGEQSLALHPLRERLAVDKRHHEEHEVVVRLDRVNGHDVWVHQLRRRARLAQEPFTLRGILREVALQQLDRDRALEGYVAGQEHYPHAAAPNFPLERIAPRNGCL